MIGKASGVSWTKLASTATAGSNQLVLEEAVTWSVNDEVVIASTSYDYNQNEVHVITTVSADGLTLTLQDSLQYEHIGRHFMSNGKLS